VFAALVLALPAHPSLAAQRAEQPAAPAAPDTAARWGYDEAPGVVPPDRWGELPDGLACGHGHHQSPIALYTSGDQAARRVPIFPLVFMYRPVPLHLIDNGRFVSLACDSGGKVSLAGAEARIFRVDLHAPSEHTLDGTRFPMELEFVHRGGADGPAVIVSVFVRAGAKNAALEAILRALPSQRGGESEPAGIEIDPGALLPASRNYLDYRGSFTSPPCTEGVRWCVLRTPIEASQDQLDRYLGDPRLAHSSRPIMPTNDRPVRMGTQP